MNDELWTAAPTLRGVCYSSFIDHCLPFSVHSSPSLFLSSSFIVQTSASSVESRSEGSALRGIHMLVAPTPRFRKSRRVPEDVASVPSPLALVLVSATYDGGAQQVTLQFDRAIDVSSMDVSQVVVYDGSFRGAVMTGWRTPNLTAPDTVVIDLDAGDSYRSETLLEATASSGLKAVDDGGMWAGVTDLALPFP
jgi:hypothetical protein